MTRLAADLRAAALVNETIAFELNAAAVHFDGQGQRNVAQALRQQAATLLAEASRLQAEAEGLPHDNSTNKCPTALGVEDEPAVLETVLSKLKDGASAR
ncbi:hypothetical protein [Methylobacterium nigriterrae]|uniref:hypothetical protein n=1 Tax=Methylobacterium nigriterrae TaxID=3127512 RepID=UPI0030132C70